jgi:hypothetical protein
VNWGKVLLITSLSFFCGLLKATERAGNCERSKIKDLEIYPIVFCGQGKPCIVQMLEIRELERSHSSSGTELWGGIST